ncbi:hypothetical protein Pint_17301 [Pistacia integerrima]|uniref:Uncharacterized protein n=1 Tax=Pistacia integerrima TaxID=434235 RepID=A0ACC0YWM0_9ROSI|nr:hypothetical protein Pint_17301 [Pistacia integerrima]
MFSLRVLPPVQRCVRESHFPTTGMTGNPHPRTTGLLVGGTGDLYLRPCLVLGDGDFLGPRPHPCIHGGTGGG